MGRETRNFRADAALARKIQYGLAVCLALTVLSVGFVDRPLALLVHGWMPLPGIAQNVLQAMTRIPELIGVLAVVLVVGLGLLRLARGAFVGLSEGGFLASVSVIVAEAIKTALKLVCGRTWPETWINGNPSFIRDGVYGFFPFHGGVGWGAFPSGHTCAVCACMAVLWQLWPRWRVFYGLAVAATAFGLLGMNYHYLADVLAGGFLGWAVGVATVRIGVFLR
jgi:membrane-associated phospholipid phosphatase